MYKFIILGAGPAGLTFANVLKQNGVNNFLVLEKEDEAGGLCRSKMVDGTPFDIGGGHFLDVRRPKVNEFLFKFMPISEWNVFDRDSRIEVNNQLISHPLEANIWQMKLEDQVDYLKSIALAGCNIGEDMPIKFIDWIYWKLGSKIAENYMIPYNKKMFGDQLNLLGTYWLEKLPNVSFEETLLSCLEKKAYGKQPGHAQFYYPKNFGYGELWLRMADSIKDNILYHKTVNYINFENNCVETVDGEVYNAEYIITSIPWTSFECIKGMPVDLIEGISQLKHTSIKTEYFPETLKTDCQWIYFPDESLSYHRILVRSNFCSNSRGYWTETNLSRCKNKETTNFVNINEYAYPLNTIEKPNIMSKLLAWSKNHNVYGLGRWGEHNHYNSDLTVELAMNLAVELLEK